MLCTGIGMVEALVGPVTGPPSHGTIRTANACYILALVALTTREWCMPSPASGASGNTRVRTMPRTRRRRLAVTALVVVDALAILCAALTATWLWFDSFTAPVNLESPDLHIAFWQLALIVVPLWVAMLALTGLYDLDRVSWGLW